MNLFDFVYPLRFGCLLALLFLKVDRNVHLRIDNRSNEKCNFSYILHWNPNLDRAVVLEIDFVRFRLREVFAA